MAKTGAHPLTFLTVKRKLRFIKPDGVIKNDALLEICQVICFFFPSYCKQAVTQKKTGTSENELCC